MLELWGVDGVEQDVLSFDALLEVLGESIFFSNSSMSDRICFV
jgi:hypothetical protein